MGRTRIYKVERLSFAESRRTFTDPSGAQTVIVNANDGNAKSIDSSGTERTVRYGPDPRWGMLAPFPTSALAKTPSGLTRTITRARTAILSDLNNPLSLTRLTDTDTENGATSVAVFDAGTRKRTNASPEGRAHVREIDSLGRVVRTQIGELDAITYSYDAKGRLSTVMVGEGSTARTNLLTY